MIPENQIFLTGNKHSQIGGKNIWNVCGGECLNVLWKEKKKKNIFKKEVAAPKALQTGKVSCSSKTSEDNSSEERLFQTTYFSAGDVYKPRKQQLASYLRHEHFKLGLCPGLLNRLYEPYPPTRQFLAPFLKGSQDSACTLAHRTLQWDGLVCTSKRKIWDSGPNKLCARSVSHSTAYNMDSFGHYMVLHLNMVSPHLASH